MKPIARASFPATKFCLAIAAAAVWIAASHWRIEAAESAGDSNVRWWKGNLHTHSFWSDGDQFPEMVVAWYKDHDYNFLALSDHNRMLEGERWLTVSTNRGAAEALKKYEKEWGTNWVQVRSHGTNQQVRLKTLEDFRGKLEVPGKFLLIPGEEITDNYQSIPIHLNASNLRELIPPQGGQSIFEVIQNDIKAVLDQRQRTGQPMIPHVNHPNFGWALTAEDMERVQGEKFFEVFNGHPIVHNNGADSHASVERIWDILLTRRLAELNLDVIWGTAVDDAHNYHQYNSTVSNPGRGWIMVRSANLDPASLLAAMEAGDFYASSGVKLKEIRRSKTGLYIEIDAEPGVNYTTIFIGTRKGYDAHSEPVKKDGKELRVTRRYSKDVGATLAEIIGTSASYQLKGDEIYVRARIESSKASRSPTSDNPYERAWVQPLVTGVK